MGVPPVSGLWWRLMGMKGHWSAGSSDSEPHPSTLPLRTEGLEGPDESRRKPWRGPWVAIPGHLLGEWGTYWWKQQAWQEGLK